MIIESPTVINSKHFASIDGYAGLISTIVFDCCNYLGVIPSSLIVNIKDFPKVREKR